MKKKYNKECFENVLLKKEKLNNLIKKYSCKRLFIKNKIK